MGFHTSAPKGHPEAAALIAAVEARFGLKLHRGLHSALARAGRELFQSGDVRTWAEAAARVTSGGDADPVVRRMREAASIQETYFFRSLRQLEQMRKVVLSQIVEPKRKRKVRFLRIWSAGCATGEEAYTLAILFRQEVPDFDLQIVATDMNAQALEFARAGVYRTRSFRRVRPEPYRDFFKHREGHWEVAKEIRKLVTFTTLNIVTDPIPDMSRGIFGFDLVVCRNVLIYIDSDRIPEVMRKMSAASAAESVLLVAPAEYPAAKFAVGYRTEAVGLLTRSLPKPSVLDSSALPLPRPAPTSKPAQAPPSLSGDARAETEKPFALPESSASDRSRAIMSRAKEAADVGQLQLARDLIGQAVLLQPDSPYPFYLSGAIWAAAKEAKNAIQEFRRALYLDRTFVAAEIGLANALLKERHPAEARKHFQRALRLLDNLPTDGIVEGLEVTVESARKLAISGRGRAEGPETTSPP